MTIRWTTIWTLSFDELKRKGGETRMQTARMSVTLRPGESQESLLKRFRKEVVKGRVLSTYRKKRWYVSKSEQRRLAKQRAVRKARRKMLRRQAKQSR
jgi:small subunit ribosomal protein S21